MRKFVKIALISFLVIALGIGGTIFYFTKVKTYEVADQEVDEILEKDYDIVLPPGAPGADGGQQPANGKVGEGNGEGTAIAANGQTTGGSSVTGQAANGQTADSASTNGQATGSSGAAGQTADGKPANGQAANPAAEGTQTNGSTNGTSASGSKTTNSSSPSQNSGSKVTVQSIKERYRPSFTHLQAQAEANVNGVVSRAAKEYGEKRAKGETINPAYFYQKYYGAASELEAKTDAAFNTVYSSLQTELKNNGFSASHANEFKEQYESAKKERESALTNKIKGAL
ncbi:MAG TPA: hypothetical protein VEY51_17670 [Chondromyces sp.]|nr:hypothetical protein [Chondromyces sp.]